MQAVTLTRTYTLCAAHELYRPQISDQENKALYGDCSQIHGHQYTVEIVLTGEINPQTGMLINAHDVDKIAGQFLKENVDHKFLNKDVSFFKDKPPTAEWIAVWVYQELKEKFPKSVHLTKVIVHETPTMSVEYGI